MGTDCRGVNVAVADGDGGTTGSTGGLTDEAVPETAGEDEREDETEDEGGLDAVIEVGVSEAVMGEETWANSAVAA